MMADGARVAGVGHRDDADAHVPRLLHGHLHRLGAEYDGQAFVGVYVRDGGRVADHLYVRPGVQRAGRVPLDVGSQHVRDAVGLDATQVRRDKHLGAQRGVIGLHSHLLEDGRHGLSERVVCDPDLVILRDLESLKHLHSPWLSCGGVGSSWAMLGLGGLAVNGQNTGLLLVASVFTPSLCSGGLAPILSGSEHLSLFSVAPSPSPFAGSISRCALYHVPSAARRLPDGVQRASARSQIGSRNWSPKLANGGVNLPVWGLCGAAFWHRIGIETVAVTIAAAPQNS